MFVEYWAGNELEGSPDGKWKKPERVQWAREKYLAIDSYWFGKLMSREVGAAQNFDVQERVKA